MSTEQTFKRTCDGCGATQTWNDDGKTSVPPRLWYSVRVEFSTRKILGQRRGTEHDASIDACSAACVNKALAKISVPEMPAEEAPDAARPS